MLLTTRRKIKKITVRLFWFLLLALVVWANFNRFHHNNFANYEKAVDYGRVREKKEIIRPVIAAVFYQNQQPQKSSLSSYLSHWDNRHIKNPKMLIVPPRITAESKRVISKLYKTIAQKADFDKVLFVYNAGLAQDKHNALIKRYFTAAKLQTFPTDEEKETPMETLVTATLKKPHTLVIFALDLNDTEQNKFLADEVIYFAQQHFYKLGIFDEVDTQLAHALEENYASWFESANEGETQELQRQKINLEAYKNHYSAKIIKYFAKNLRLPAGKSPLWPQKNEQNYRLFDRGTVYIRFFGSGDKELFSRAKIGKNKGIIVAVIELARKAIVKVGKPIKYYRIYLLTELEKIKKEANAPLINYLETDDGVYVQYHNRRTLMAADERPDQEELLMEALRDRAKIPASATDAEIEFYRFKTVEIEHEN